MVDILNSEAWCSLALAILSSSEFTPDEACAALADGKRVRNKVDVIVPEIIALREKGIPWNDVAAKFGISKHSAYSIVSRWKKRQKAG